MSGRPRAGRGMTGRDGKESDLENDLLSRAIESLRKAQGYNDESRRLGQEIVTLEDEIKTTGRMLYFQMQLNVADSSQIPLRNSTESLMHSIERICDTLNSKRRFTMTMTLSTTSPFWLR